MLAKISCFTLLASFFSLDISRINHSSLSYCCEGFVCEVDWWSFVTDETTGIVFSIFSGDPDQYFIMDRVTGEITCSDVNADRERNTFVLLTVRAEKADIFATTQV